MIVTLDDYRGAIDAKPVYDEEHVDDGTKFTVANAGVLKLKLQALHRLFTRTALDHHSSLHFDEILKIASSRTYVDGSENVYFTVKGLSWPSKIPETYVEAYREVLQSRPFTNRYSYKPVVAGIRHQEMAVSARSAATFSVIRPLLPELDDLCGTDLATLFERAECRVRPFLFMQLPTELRFEIYDYLSPAHTLLRIFAKDKHDLEQISPVRLDIMRVSKALYKETADRFFNGSNLYIEVYPDLRRGVWVQAYFTKTTTIEYVARVTRMSNESKSRVTRLEIRIFPEDAASPMNSFRPEQLDTLSLRRICTEFSSLESVLVSFERIPKSLCLLDGRARWPNETSFYNGQRFTLAWIQAQLSDDGPHIYWDLTHFRQSVVDPAALLQEVLSQPMMKECIQRDGALNLAQSASATQEDLQRWQEIRDTVCEAVAPRRSNIFGSG